MTVTNHALTGALVATSVANPIIGLALALLSHFVIDTLPHWDHQVNKNLQRFVDVGDGVLAITLSVAIAWFIADHTWVILGGALMGVAPDLMWLPEILKGKKVKMKGKRLLYRVRRWHHSIQWSESPKGLLLEILFFILIINLIFLP